VYVLAGRRVGAAAVAERHFAEFEVLLELDPSVSLRTLRAEYRAACSTSNEIIAAVGDADASVTRNGKTRDLRWVLLAVIEETARHAGHADIIREQIDGQTGR
jgi:hypothetical protein